MAESKSDFNKILNGFLYFLLRLKVAITVLLDLFPSESINKSKDKVHRQSFPMVP